MPTIKELRERSRVSKELQEQQAKRIKDAVTDVVNSSAFTLTAVNHLGLESAEKVPDVAVEEFAGNIAESVVEQVNDPIAAFTDACHARGLKSSRIRKAVEFVSQTFGLEVDSPYEVKLEAVALYMQQNPKLFDDIVMLR